MKLFWLLIATAILAPCSFAKNSYAEETPDFALLDYRGKEFRLRRADAKAVVLFFTATGCPVAEQSFERLKALQKKYDRKGVRVKHVKRVKRVKRSRDRSLDRAVREQLA